MIDFLWGLFKVGIFYEPVIRGTCRGVFYGVKE